MELEIPAEALASIHEALGSQELTERVVTKRFSGHIVLKGFSDSVVGSIPNEVKIRVSAAHLGGRVRLIVDMQL